MELKIKAYAKINLMLDILSALENGYHDLFMIMQSVGLYDIVTVETTNGNDISVTCTDINVPCNETNIAYKAAKSFFEYTDIKSRGIKINIEKNIPSNAGLGGGSADGAAVIVALDKILGTKLSEKDIISIGSKVGSDVPFCALGGTIMAQYTGTVLSHLPDLSEKYIIVVKPQDDVSTSEAYAAFDKAERIRHLDTKGMLIAVMNDDWKKVSEKVDNVFEQFIEVTDRAFIKGVMRKHGCLCACMSGSGPSIFGVFDNKNEAEECLDELKKNYNNSYLSTTVTNGYKIL